MASTTPGECCQLAATSALQMLEDNDQDHQPGLRIPAANSQISKKWSEDSSGDRGRKVCRRIMRCDTLELEANCQKKLDGDKEEVWKGSSGQLRKDGSQWI